MIISTSLFLFIHKISKFIYCIRYIDITIDMIEKLLLFSGNHFLQQVTPDINKNDPNRTKCPLAWLFDKFLKELVAKIIWAPFQGTAFGIMIGNDCGMDRIGVDQIWSKVSPYVTVFLIAFSSVFLLRKSHLIFVLDAPNLLRYCRQLQVLLQSHLPTVHTHTLSPVYHFSKMSQTALIIATNQ